MAKAKKQEKTIEQRLEEALVLYEKTPYKLPSNWCWTRLGTVCKLDNGEKINNEELFYLDAKTLRTQSYEQTRKDGVVVEEGQKIILVDGENSGEIFDIPKRGYMGSTFRILDINQLVNEVYVRYFISSNQDKLRNNKIGSAIPHLNKELFFNLLFPFAPFEEQKRIVEIIEKQFAKLDEARDLIQASLDSFADRKSAILHKAFTGELTKIWREEKGIDSKWERVSLNDVSYGFQYGTSKKSEKQGKCAVVRMGNLQQGKIDWNDLVYTNDEDDIQKYRLQRGDVLFNRTNSAELVGKTSIFESDRLAIFAGYLIRINYRKELLLGRFLNYLLNSMKAKEYCMAVKSDAVNQSNINAKKLAAFTFDWPRIDEQKEIVRILDSIFEKEDKSKELLDMLDKIDEMKKSILARAFRGQLGTSNPTDEPATDLLKKILEQNN